jgi:hypothetical protein
MTVPYTFTNASGAIPLSELDDNFAAVGQASNIANTPAGNVLAVTVQAAINELDTEKVQASALANSGGSALVGYAPTGNITSNTVQGAINELDTEKVQSSAITASSGSSLVGFLQAGAGAVATTVQDKLRESVSVKDFGAVGDGVTDDTAAIQAAITYVGGAGGGVLSFERGKTYKISSALVCSYSNVTLMGNGATLNGSGIAAATAFDQIYALKIEGTIGSAITCTANIAEGAVNLSMTSTSGLAADDMLFVYSNEVYPPGTTSNDDCGAMHKVRSITSGTALVLMDGVFFAMTAAGGLSVKKVSTVSNVIVDGLNVVMGGVNKAHCGIRIKYAENVQLTDCSTRDTEDCGVRTDTVYGGGVVGGAFYNATSPADGTSGVTTVTGYGINPGTATRDFKVEKASFRNCRHAVAGGGSYPAIAVTIARNLVAGNRSAAYTASYSLDCHEDCLYWIFDGNHVSGETSTTGSGGILVRGQKTLVINNVISNAYQYGIYVINFDTTGYGIGNSIFNNIIINPRVDAIAVIGSTTSPQYDVRIGNNYIDTSGGDGITLFGVTKATISGNTVKNLGANRSGIRLVGTAATAGNRCVNTIVSNNTVDTPTLYGIRADFADTLTCSGNIVLASANDAIRLTSCSNVSITGGLLTTPYTFGSAVSLSASTKVSVSGVTAYNTGTATSISSGVYMFGASTDIAISGCQFSAFNRGVFSASPANYISAVGINARTSVTATVDVSASANTSLAGNL